MHILHFSTCINEYLHDLNMSILLPRTQFFKDIKVSLVKKKFRPQKHDDYVDEFDHTTLNDSV